MALQVLSVIGTALKEGTRLISEIPARKVGPHPF